MKRFILPCDLKPSIKKKQKVIVLCNEFKERKEEFVQQIQEMLKNFDNGLICIQNAYLRPDPENENIEYL